MKKYINFTDIQTGFNPDIIGRLAEAAHIQEIDEKGRKVISFDEMQIKSNLVYHKGTGL